MTSPPNLGARLSRNNRIPVIIDVIFNTLDENVNEY